MTVKELKDELAFMPDEMQIVQRCNSFDYIKVWGTKKVEVIPSTAAVYPCHFDKAWHNAKNIMEVLVIE